MAIKQKERSIQDIIDVIGDPHRLDEELQSFKKQARLFSSHRPRLIERYAKQWVAVHDGKVKATGRTFQSVLKQMDVKGLPREHVIVRYIDKNIRTFIL